MSESVTGPDDALARRVRAGEESALAEAFAQHRARLYRMLQFRIDPRLRVRLDADDVLQDAYLAAAQRLRHFEGESGASLFVWLRMIAQQTLLDAQRRHYGAQARNAKREVALQGSDGTSTTSSLAARLVGQLTSPTQAVRRAELSAQLIAALDQMDTIDRDVLALRHFEELTNQEVALELGIEQKAASIRYVRALRRLGNVLDSIPEFQQQSRTWV